MRLAGIRTTPPDFPPMTRPSSVWNRGTRATGIASCPPTGCAHSMRPRRSWRCRKNSVPARACESIARYGQKCPRTSQGQGQGAGVRHAAHTNRVLRKRVLCLSRRSQLARLAPLRCACPLASRSSGNVRPLYPSASLNRLCGVQRLCFSGQASLCQGEKTVGAARVCCGPHNDPRSSLERARMFYNDGKSRVATCDCTAYLRSSSEGLFESSSQQKSEFLGRPCFIHGCDDPVGLPEDTDQVPDYELQNRNLCPWSLAVS